MEPGSFGFVAYRSPNAAGSRPATVSSITMIRFFAALAILAFLGVSAIALPGFYPEVKANETMALAKANRLPVDPVVGNCASQTWPNIASTCLRQTGSDTSVREARLVTAHREP